MRHGWHTMPTVFVLFVLMPNRSKRLVRTSSALCSLSGWVDPTRLLLAYKYAVGSMIVRPISPIPASVGFPTVTQWQITAFPTMLKLFWGQGVALRYTLVHFEQAPKVPAGLGYHGQLVPVRPKESKRPGTDHVHREKFQGPLLV